MWRRTTHSLNNLILLTTCVVAQGCDRAAAASDWTTSEDTLPTGTVVVVNSPPQTARPPKLTLVEDLRIGTMNEEGPTSFGAIRGITALADGRVAVLDGQAQEIRIFDALGKHLATYGGKGEGPGELQGAWGIMQSSKGTLWVPDHSNDRMSLFDPATGFQTSFPFRVYRYGYVWDGVMASDDRVWEQSITLAEPRRDIVRVYDAQMTLVDSLPLPERPPVDQKNPPGSFYWEAPDGRSRGYRSVPFYAREIRLLDPLGAIWSTDAGDPAYRIKRWVPGGDTTLILEARRPAVPVTTAERDSVIQEVSKSLANYPNPRLDWSKIPQTKPGVRGMFLASNGDLWVHASTTDSLRVYDVYRQDGHHIGSAATSLRIVDYLPPFVRDDHFWAVVSDELDVQYVVRARIVPSADARN